jgi:hypothetical protein
VKIKKFKLEVTPEELLFLGKAMRSAETYVPGRLTRLSKDIVEQINAGMELDLEFAVLAREQGWKGRAKMEVKKDDSGEDGAPVGSVHPRE